MARVVILAPRTSTRLIYTEWRQGSKPRAHFYKTLGKMGFAHTHTGWGVQGGWTAAGGEASRKGVLARSARVSSGTRTDAAQDNSPKYTKQESEKRQADLKMCVPVSGRHFSLLA